MNQNSEQSLNIRLGIRDFIKENFLFGDDSGLSDEVSFLESGIIDSMGFLELIDFLESTYGIQIEDHELVPDNMDSLDNVTIFMMHKLGADSESQLAQSN